MGDGSFGFAAGEMETLVRLGVPVTLVVISNATFGWIKAGQKTGYDGHYLSVDFSRTDHARVAEAFGIRSWSVTETAQLAGALAQAVAAGSPPRCIGNSCRPAIAIAADQGVSRAVVAENGLGFALELRDDAVGQHLTELDAPLVEAVDVP